MLQRVIAVGIVAGLTLASLGPTTARAATWRPRLGIEAGAGVGRVSSSSLMGNGDHWSAGGSAGLVARWALTAAWAIEAAPGWERVTGRGTGTITVGGSSPIGFDQRVHFDRVALPLRASLQPGGAGWSLEAGVTTAWLARAGRDARLTTDPDLTTPGSPARGPATGDAAIFEEVGAFDDGDWTEAFHRWDFGVAAGLGWDRPLASSVLRARVRWQQGLTDVSRFGEPVKLTSITANVGLLW